MSKSSRFHDVQVSGVIEALHCEELGECVRQLGTVPMASTGQSLFAVVIVTAGMIT